MTATRSQELQQPIHIAIRIHERSELSCLSVRNSKTIEVLRNSKSDDPKSIKSFQFERVFGSWCGPKDIYNYAKFTIDAVLGGYNSAIVVCGCRQSGKSYSLHGNDKKSGIIQFSFYEILDRVRGITFKDDAATAYVSVSYLQYDKGTTKSLLHNTNDEPSTSWRVPITSVEDALLLHSKGYSLISQAGQYQSVFTVYLEIKTSYNSYVYKSRIRFVDIEECSLFPFSFNENFFDQNNFNQEFASILSDCFLGNSNTLVLLNLNNDFLNEEKEQMLELLESASIMKNKKTFCQLVIDPFHQSFVAQVLEQLRQLQIQLNYFNKKVKDLKNKCNFISLERNCTYEASACMEETLEKCRISKNELIRLSTQVIVSNSHHLSFLLQGYEQLEYVVVLEIEKYRTGSEKSKVKQMIHQDSCIVVNSSLMGKQQTSELIKNLDWDSSSKLVLELFVQIFPDFSVRNFYQGIEKVMQQLFQDVQFDLHHFKQRNTHALAELVNQSKLTKDLCSFILKWLTSLGLKSEVHCKKFGTETLHYLVKYILNNLTKERCPEIVFCLRKVFELEVVADGRNGMACCNSRRKKASKSPEELGLLRQQISALSSRLEEVIVDAKTIIESKDKEISRIQSLLDNGIDCKKTSTSNMDDAATFQGIPCNIDEMQQQMKKVMLLEEKLESQNYEMEKMKLLFHDEKAILRSALYKKKEEARATKTELTKLNDLVNEVVGIVFDEESISCDLYENLEKLKCKAFHLDESCAAKNKDTTRQLKEYQNEIRHLQHELVATQAALKGWSIHEKKTNILCKEKRENDLMQNEDIQQRIRNSTELEIESLRKKLKTCAHMNRTLQEDSKGLRKKIKVYQKENVEMEMESKNVLEKLQICQKNKEEEEKKMKFESNRLQESLEMYEKENVNLKMEQKRLLEKLEIFQREVEEGECKVKFESNRLNEKFEMYERENATIKLELKNLLKKLEKSQRKEKECEWKLEDTYRELQEYLSQIKSLKDDKLNFENQMEKNKAQYKELEDTLTTDHKKKTKEFSNALKTCENELKTLHHEKSNLETLLEKKSSLEVIWQKEKEKNIHIIRVLQNEIEQLNLGKSRQLKDLQNAGVNQRKLEEEVKELLQNQYSMKDEIEKLKEEKLFCNQLMIQQKEENQEKLLNQQEWRKKWSKARDEIEILKKQMNEQENNIVQENLLVRKQKEKSMVLLQKIHHEKDNMRKCLEKLKTVHSSQMKECMNDMNEIKRKSMELCRVNEQLLEDYFKLKDRVTERQGYDDKVDKETNITFSKVVVDKETNTNFTEFQGFYDEKENQVGNLVMKSIVKRTETLENISLGDWDAYHKLESDFSKSKTNVELDLEESLRAIRHLEKELLEAEDRSQNLTMSLAHANDLETKATQKIHLLYNRLEHIHQIREKELKQLQQKTQECIYLHAMTELGEKKRNQLEKDLQEKETEIIEIKTKRKLKVHGKTNENNSIISNLYLR